MKRTLTLILIALTACGSHHALTGANPDQRPALRAKLAHKCGIDANLLEFDHYTSSSEQKPHPDGTLPSGYTVFRIGTSTQPATFSEYLIDDSGVAAEVYPDVGHVCG